MAGGGCRCAARRALDRPSSPRQLLQGADHRGAHPLQATVYVYELVEGQVKVDKLEFAKPQEQGVGVGTRQL